MAKKLPVTPMMQKRYDRAEEVVNHYAERNSREETSTLEELAVDIITDLMHYLKSYNHRPSAIIASAKMHYDEEK